MIAIKIIIRIILAHPVVVFLYTLLYKAFLGFVNTPYPDGTFNPKDCLAILFKDVLAEILLLNEGVLKPNFIFLIFNKFI